VKSKLNLEGYHLAKKNEEILVRVTYANIFFTGRG
jgi:hypothetical protein